MTRAGQKTWAINIPDRELLEGHYSKFELDQIDLLRACIKDTKDPQEAWEVGREFLNALWPDEYTYLWKTTWIHDREDNNIKLLRPNKSQMELLKLIKQMRDNNEPIRIVICKARQLGMSTLMQALHYRWCDQHQLRNSMTISHGEKPAKKLFKKASLIHNRQWFPRPQATSRRDEIVFDEPHYSAFYCHTANNEDATRGDSLQHVHCSEIPFWESAEETLTAVHQCVPLQPGTSIVYESTARGAVGPFYETWQRAVRGQSSFRPFFAPWFWKEDYQLQFATDADRNRFLRKMNPDDKEYMERYGVTPEQMRWRDYKLHSELHGNPKLWDQEYPAEAEIAFLTSGSPVFNMRRIIELRNQCEPPIWTGDMLLDHEVAAYREQGGPLPRME